MDTAPIDTPDRADRLGLIAGPLVVLAVVVWLCGWTGSDETNAAGSAAWVLLTSAPLAIAWLAAAIGYGWLLRRWLVRDGDGLAIQAGVGVAMMLFLDAALGPLGFLQLGGSIGAWVLLVVGVLLLAEQSRRWFNSAQRAVPLPSWLAWTAAPAIAVLLLTACSAPGWLWASEFGGYDALSYHLQLPKEWLAMGRIEPLNHNVYSYLPGYVEAAYYHLAVLRGDGVEAAYACQLLHAGFTLFTAAIVGRLAWRIGGRIAGGVAAVVMLGTPWVIVVGSLAYNEMAVALMLATGLLITSTCSEGSWRCGVMLGIVAAAACGAKLTSAGFVAVPLGLLILATVGTKRLSLPVIAGCTAGLIVLLPYLLRNWIYAGNPIFPFATGAFGLGHWTAEQAEIWMRGHVSDVTFGGRLGEMWHQLWRYGLGPNPDATGNEPWQPQWSILPWLTAGGLALGLISKRSRPWARRLAVVLLVQTLFWLALTHVKSRFMLPAVVPASLAMGVAVASLAKYFGPGKARYATVFVLASAGLAWSVLPVVIFACEANSAPAQRIGWTDVITGDSLTALQRRELADQSPIIMINHALPAQSNVLLIGDATPLYYRAAVTYQTTWDRGPLSRAMLAHPDTPSAWFDRLREDGFTHLFVEPTMLRIWEQQGWNDPQITADRVIDAADRFTEPLHEFPTGVRLYRLR